MVHNELALLALLKEAPMHGYQIVHEIQHRNMDKWANIAVASIYNMLNSLEKNKLIFAKKERIGNMPERKVYQITSAGTQKLKHLIKDGLRHIDKNNKIIYLLSVFFMNHISPPEARAALEQRKKPLEFHLEMLKKIYQTHKKFLPFHNMYIITAIRDHMMLEYKSLLQLIQRVKKTSKWETVDKEKCQHCQIQQGGHV